MAPRCQPLVNLWWTHTEGICVSSTTDQPVDDLYNWSGTKGKLSLGNSKMDNGFHPLQMCPKESHNQRCYMY
ncbi:hypothetical protein ScPMuIL_005060 [Solemya velum]